MRAIGASCVYAKLLVRRAGAHAAYVVCGEARVRVMGGVCPVCVCVWMRCMSQEQRAFQGCAIGEEKCVSVGTFPKFMDHFTTDVSHPPRLRRNHAAASAHACTSTSTVVSGCLGRGRVTQPACRVYHDAPL